MAAMREIHDEFDGTYGEPRMTAELVDRGWRGEPQAGGAAHARPRHRRGPQAGQGPHDDPRRGRPTAARSDWPALRSRRADVAWVGDITYIPTGEGWLYLASVLDLGSGPPGSASGCATATVYSNPSRSTSGIRSRSSLLRTWEIMSGGERSALRRQLRCQLPDCLHY